MGYFFKLNFDLIRERKKKTLAKWQMQKDYQHGTLTQVEDCWKKDKLSLINRKSCNCGQDELKKAERKVKSQKPKAQTEHR